MPFEGLCALFVAAVAIHNIEEAVWLPAWTQTTPRWHTPVGTREFRFAVTALTALAALVAAAAVMGGKGSVGAYLVCGYALAMLLNVFVPHLAVTMATRRYMPGTGTALALILPVTAALIHRAAGDGFVVTPAFLAVGAGVVLALLLLIPALFWLGRRI